MIELYKALGDAQQEFGALTKDATNPHFRSKYATLENVINTVKATLHKHGLVMYQGAGGEVDDNGVYRLLVTSKLIHMETGQELTETLPVPLAKQDPQGMGAALTYGRRYLAMTQLGLAPEDDDGNAASQPPPPPAQRNVPQQRQQKAPPPQQAQAANHTPHAGTEKAHVLQHYAALLNDPDADLDPATFEYIVAMRELDAGSQYKVATQAKPGKKMSQYQFLVAKVDEFCGQEMHGPVLSTIMGRPIHVGDPPGSDIRPLLDALVDGEADVITHLKNVAELCRNHPPGPPSDDVEF